ncbi:MAG: iron-containing redox enzyme family protein [Oligoflexia bacterium]|nr:iron-containing redox enzyme family protein [Oligoflexia bacterium]
MTKDDVKKVFKQTHERMNKVAQEFPWENKEAYLSWLAQTMEYVTYGTRILALTAGTFPLDQTPLTARFIQHATEEKGHEKLLINDAKALGMNIEKIAILPEAEAFHKSVYYWIYQHRPAVIMGWILFLEGFAIISGPGIHKRVEAAYGKKPTSFARVHTNEDPDHVDKAMDILDYFSAYELKDIIHGLELYSSLYTNILKAVPANLKKQSVAA